MNRIYKVVWSKAKNCYTVVSEIAKRHGKGNRARTCTAAFLAAFALTGVMGMGEAQAAPDANVYTVNTLNANNNLTVGGIAGNGFYQFFVDSNGAFHAAANKFSVDEDGKVTATEGEIGGVTIKEGNITGVSAINTSAINTSAINTNVLNSKYNLSVGTANPNGTMPFFVNSNGAFYAANGKLVVDKDGNVTAGNVVLKNGVFTGNSKLLDGELFVGDASTNYSQITTKGAKLGKVTIDENGNIAGANSIQTNVLNSKYNLSVGTANPNGTMPFFVNSNGAFYAANGKLVVDKDGNVTAGNVVLKNGVFTGNSKLLDGELFVGDASTNYSQITTKGAKLGKVTIDENGNIAGANSIQTNVLNSKYNLSVGTANPNGTMPFFVNSNGAFYAANGKLVVDKDGNVTAGNVVLKNGVFTGNSKLLDGELFVGNASGNYSQITPKSAKLGKVTIDEKGKISGVAAGAVTAGSTDAVNGSQLHAVATEAAKHSKVVNGSNIKVEEAEVSGQKIYKVGLNDDVLLGKPTGNNVSISGTKGTIETTGYIATKDRIIADKGAQLAGINVSGNIISNGAARIALYGDSGVAGMVNGKGASIYMQAGNTVINSKVAIDQNGKITGVAAGAITADSTDAVNGSQLKQTNDNVASNTEAIGNLNTRVDGLDDRVTSNTAAINKNTEAIGTLNTRVDGLDDRVTNNTEAIGNLNTRVDGLDTRVTDVENLAKKHTTVEAGNNITVTETTNTDGGKKYTVGMAKDITVDSVNVGGKTYVSEAGLNANGNKVTQVADGNIDKDSKDAVNGGQLYATNQLVKENASNISLLGNSINKLDNRVDKVGAGAAALAALQPLGFDPEDKWDFAAGYGNYSGASAVALGAYYRPNEDTMFSVGGSFGNGENMVNAGVSLKLGQSNHTPASKAAMEKKISALSQEVEELKAAIADLRAAQTKAKDATEKDAQKK